MDGGDNQVQQSEQQNGSSADEDSRKLFIGGLSGHVTKEDLQSYFDKYGTVEMCTIKTDVYTGRSRGFGFLIFKEQSAVAQVLAEAGTHEIDGKQIDPKLATPQAKSEPPKNNKIFVGGLDRSATKEDVEDAFKVKGTVVDVFLPTDRNTGEPKGFAFVTFDDKDVAEALCEDGKFTICGREVDVKTAKSKSDRGGFRGGRGGGRGGFRGGRGGGRGGYGYGGGYDQGYNGGYGGGYSQTPYGGGYGGADYNGGGHYASNYGQYDQGSYAQY